jgi:hypothetical protein
VLLLQVVMNNDKQSISGNRVASDFQTKSQIAAADYWSTPLLPEEKLGQHQKKNPMACLGHFVCVTFHLFIDVCCSI